MAARASRRPTPAASEDRPSTHLENSHRGASRLNYDRSLKSAAAKEKNGSGLRTGVSTTGGDRGTSTQEDPVGLAGGLNAYGFATGDPVNFSDPFGLCIPWPACAFAAAEAGAGWHASWWCDRHDG